MKRKVKFAILQYVPNYDRDEKINVGVVLHCPIEKYLKIIFIENFKRLKEFDDELDLKFIKLYFKSLEEAFYYNPLISADIDIESIYLLDDMTKYYINQFVFKVYELMEINKECEEFIYDLKNNYLYYDVKKENRISPKESIAFFKDLLNGKNISYEEIRGKNSLYGNFNDKINVDLKIGKDYYKLITINDQNVDKYIPTIKMWMLNSIELKDKGERLIFVINEQISDTKTKNIVSMLKKYGTVIYLNNIDDYFTSKI